MPSVQALPQGQGAGLQLCTELPGNAFLGGQASLNAVLSEVHVLLLQDAFVEKHGVKLGFMSAFVKASADALHLVPAANAVIDGDEIVYRWAASNTLSGCTATSRLQVTSSSAWCCTAAATEQHVCMALHLGT